MDATTNAKTLFVDANGVATGVGGIEWDHGEISIGGDMDNGTPLAFFGGQLDEPRIYRRVCDGRRTA